MIGIRKESLIIHRKAAHLFFLLQNSTKYLQEDEMPNRLGLLHVRPGSERQATEEEEVDKVVAKINDRTEMFIKEREAADSPEAVKLGLKVEADEVEKFMSASMQERSFLKLILTSYVSLIASL